MIKSVFMFTVLMAIGSSFAMADVTVQCGTGGNSYLKATYSEDTHKVLFEEENGKSEQGVSYARLSASDAKNDDTIVSLARLAGVKMSKVAYVDQFLLVKTNEGNLALISYRSKTKVLGTAMINGMSPLICR